jgi:hypothetical protein
VTDLVSCVDSHLWAVEIEIEVILGPTVSRQGYLGVGPSVWANYQIFPFFSLFIWQFLCSKWGAVSDKRTGLQFALQSVVVPGRRGPITITALSHSRPAVMRPDTEFRFVVAYDSQGLRCRYSSEHPHRRLVEFYWVNYIRHWLILLRTAVGQSSWLQTQRTQVRFSALPDFLTSIGSETESTQPREQKWGATWKKCSGSGL